MKAIAILFGGLLAAAAVAGLAYWGTYNNLVGLREESFGKASEVQVACQRQADLVPNLVKAVKAYSKHESETLTRVTEARNSVQKLLASIKPADIATNPQMQQQLAQAQDGLRVAINAVAESYPQLKADGLHRDLMAELAGSQNRISVARTMHVRATKSYNAARKGLLTQTFMAGSFEELPYYEAPVGNTSTVEVDL